LTSTTIKYSEPERFRSDAYRAVWSDVASPSLCVMSAQAERVMREVAAAAYPDEACGLLLGTVDAKGWQVREARRVDNVNTDRASDRFQLDPEAYQRIDREIRGSGVEIIGVFHSHPDCPAKPSPTDMQHAWEGFVYPIVSVYQGVVADIAYWEPQDASSCFHPVTCSETQA